ncbi:MAG: glycosyltransferase family 4 protein [Anaerolineae bacterium]|nr:glycosyltransferase family 4 protein [Anaerolineae bacterium]
MPKQILFITWYTGLGGGETALLALADALDPARYVPHLAAPREGQLTEQWRKREWPVHILPFRGASTWFVPFIWARFPIVGKLRMLIQEQGFAAVYSDYHSLPYALPAAEGAGAASLWLCHGWWFKPKFWQRAFFRRPSITGFAASWAIRDGFLGDPPFMPPEQLPVLPLGVNTRRFKPDNDGAALRKELNISSDVPLVALIARFQDVKGHDIFQDMARRVAAEIPEARFIVAGDNVHGVSADDAYKARILRRWKDDPLLSQVIQYIGFREDAEQVIAAADVIACTSHFESYGMVNLEAMASGKPVVSTRRGGPSETILEGVTGYLIDSGDTAQFATHVIALLRDPALRQQMGEAGRARVLSQFSAEQMAAQFMAALDRVISDV